MPDVFYIGTYYAKNYAGIIGLGLMKSIRPKMKFYCGTPDDYNTADHSL